MNVLTKTTIAGLKCFHRKGLNCVCVCLFACLRAHACVCMHSVQKQLRPCVAQTASTGRWVEYEFTSDETSPTVKLQRVLFIVLLLDTSSDSKVNFNISYPRTVLKMAMTKKGERQKRKDRIHKLSQKCPKTYSMMQTLRGISYINTQHYIILMPFSPVAVSVILREGSRYVQEK